MRKYLHKLLIDPFLFVVFNNLRFKIKKIDLKIRKLQKGKCKYQVTGEGITRYYNIEQQSYLSFHNGFFKRAKDLGKNIYMLDKINFNDQDTFIDIGANTVDLYLYFDLILKKPINYLAIEPGVEEFECLKLNIPDSKNKVFQYGMGKENKTSLFYYKPSNGDSSFIKMDGFIKEFEIQEKTLDKFIMDLSLSYIKLLKLEAEGYEPEIISGLNKHINKVEYISADLGFERGITQDATSPSVLNYLIKNNFEIISQSRKRNVFLLKNNNIIK